MADQQQLKTTCGTCGKVIKFPPQFAGRTADCPNCGDKLRLYDRVYEQQKEREEAAAKEQAEREAAEKMEASVKRVVDKATAIVKPSPATPGGHREYRRTCQRCSKVWHSLVSREKAIKNDQACSSCFMCGTIGDSGSFLQADRNRQAATGELDRLKQCPECGSANYDEEIV